jgi:hypothetical protein
MIMTKEQKLPSKRRWHRSWCSLNLRRKNQELQKLSSKQGHEMAKELLLSQPEEKKPEIAKAS